MRLYTLGSRRSRELKTFLETRLISSRVDQKLSFKGRIHGILMREIGPIFRAMETVVGAIFSVVEAVSLGEDVASGLALTQPQFRFNFCFKMAMIFATIKPRSDRDRATIVVLVLRWSPCRSTRDECPTIPRQNLLDRGSIALLSRFDRAAIVEFFHDVPPSLDWTSSDMDGHDRVTVAVGSRSRGGVNRQSYICEDRDEDYCEQSGASISRCPLRRLMEIAWSSSRQRSDALDASTWRKVSPKIISLTPYF